MSNKFVEELKQFNEEYAMLMAREHRRRGDYIRARAKYQRGERVLALIRIINLTTYYPCIIIGRGVGEDGRIWYEVTRDPEREQVLSEHKAPPEGIKVAEEDVGPYQENWFKETWLFKPPPRERKAVRELFPLPEPPRLSLIRAVTSVFRKPGNLDN